MARSIYKRPPIVEAVIEIRCEEVDKASIDTVQKQLRRKYPISEDFSHVNFRIDVSKRALQQEVDAIGYRLRSSDSADIQIITSSIFSAARLAPYQSWETFSGLAKANWAAWKKIVGYKKIKRIGVRYINRIDVPWGGATHVRTEDYLRFNPGMPDSFPPISAYVMNVVVPGQDECNLVINSNTIASPLIDHASFILDIDIIRESSPPPQNDKEMWSLIDRIRIYKNEIFESCITDKARELFNT